MTFTDQIGNLVVFLVFLGIFVLLGRLRGACAEEPQAWWMTVLMAGALALVMVPVMRFVWFAALIVFWGMSI